MVTLHNLSVNLFGKEILSNISFDLGQDKIIGLIGKNGVGKSTLLKTLSGFIKEYNGDIKINKISLNNYKIKNLSKIRAFVSAQENINTEFITVYQYLCFGRHIYLNFLGNLTQKDYDIISKVIDETEINALINSDIKNLSSGEFQRIQIARALIQEPEIILLDEPTAHLDINFQIKIMKLLKKISKNIKIICILHDINMAYKLCEKVILLKDNTIFAIGKTQDVINQKNLKTIFDCEWELIETDKGNYFFPLIS
ncbi:MAG: ABC transporter ATP-binding protein [Candidatus Sericytochromatia bacterium]